MSAIQSLKHLKSCHLYRLLDSSTRRVINDDTLRIAFSPTHSQFPSDTRSLFRSTFALLVFRIQYFLAETCYRYIIVTYMRTERFLRLCLLSMYIKIKWNPFMLSIEIHNPESFSLVE